MRNRPKHTPANGRGRRYRAPQTHCSSPSNARKDNERKARTNAATEPERNIGNEAPAVPLPLLVPAAAPSLSPLRGLRKAERAARWAGGEAEIKSTYTRVEKNDHREHKDAAAANTAVKCKRASGVSRSWQRHVFMPAVRRKGPRRGAVRYRSGTGK